MMPLHANALLVSGLSILLCTLPLMERTQHQVHGFTFTTSRSRSMARPWTGTSPMTTATAPRPRRGSIVLRDVEEPSGGSSSSSSSSAPSSDLVLSSLTSTEEWIQRTLNLASSRAAADDKTNGASNPYTRKEVSYECEVSPSVPSVVSGIFRRLKEMRRIGESHGIDEVRRRERLGEDRYRPHTHRQTLVVVVPACPEISNEFDTFDRLVGAINGARRDARDYVTDASLDRLKSNGGANADDPSDEWITSVNLAHLHPTFGETAEQKGSADEGAVDADANEEDEDPKVRAHRMRRLQARRSPFPSLVVELKSVPPQIPTAPADGRESHTAGAPQPSPSSPVDPAVSREDVLRLEALFGKKADCNPAEEVCDADVDRHDEVEQQFEQYLSPIGLGQNWITENDPDHDEDVDTFSASSDVGHVDEACEFVFASVAEALETPSSLPEPTTAGKPSRASRRDYLILPNFLSRSATSFEKFAARVQDIVDAIPHLGDVLTVDTYHREHVDGARRSPVPVFVLEWKAADLNDVSKWHS